MRATVCCDGRCINADTIKRAAVSHAHTVCDETPLMTSLIGHACLDTADGRVALATDRDGDTVLPLRLLLPSSSSLDCYCCGISAASRRPTVIADTRICLSSWLTPVNRLTTKTLFHRRPRRSSSLTFIWHQNQPSTHVQLFSYSSLLSSGKRKRTLHCRRLKQFLFAHNVDVC